MILRCKKIENTFHKNEHHLAAKQKRLLKALCDVFCVMCSVVVAHVLAKIACISSGYKTKIHPRIEPENRNIYLPEFYCK